MSDQRKSISPTLLRRRPAEIGKIKIGRLGEERPKSNGEGTWRLPEKLDHFIVTKREREGGDRDANFVRDEEVHARVGAEPTELDVRLMFDEPTDNFFSQMQVYKGRERVRECDGEAARDPRNETEQACAYPECNCKPYGRLSVMLEAAPTFGSVYVFRTTSWESVRNIQTTLEMLHEQFGFLAGLPLRLKVYPATDQYEQGGKTRTSTSYKVALELRGTWEQAAELAREAYRKRLGNEAQLKALAAAREEELDALDEAEEPEIASEFHPDPNAKADVETAERIEKIKSEAGIEADAEEVSPEGEASEEEDDETSGADAEPSGDETRKRQAFDAFNATLKKYITDAETRKNVALAYAQLRDDQPDRITEWTYSDYERATKDITKRGMPAIEECYEWMDEETAEQGDLMSGAQA